MDYVGLHALLDETEKILLSFGGNIAFDVHVNGEAVPSYYENQFYNEGQRPIIVYNAEQGLYYFGYGPRLTPGKRPYPTRYFNGELDGSQPEYYYATVQQVDFAIILEHISDTQYRVWPDATKGWPEDGPFYVYLCQKDEGSGENAEQQFGPTYRYVKIEGDDAKIRVESHVDGVITLAKPLILDVPAEDEPPYFFAFFTRRIDDKLKREVVQLAGDETHESISITDSTEVVAVDNLSSFYITIHDVYIHMNDDTYEFVESSMPNPEDDQEVLILLRADSGTIIRSDKVKITNAVLSETTEDLVYTDIDPSDPFLNLDIYPVDDPFEDLTPPDDLTPGTDIPDPERIPTGKVVHRTFRVDVTPFVSTLEIGNDFAYFEEVLAKTSPISDEELSIELPATSWSLRPHTFLTLDPLKAPALADVYGFNWAAPIPYPEKTCVEDCDEPVVNGFLADAVSKHRMNYRRDRNSWFVGGTVYCVCRNFKDAAVVEDCILLYNFQTYFKLRSLAGNLSLYHMAYTEWR